MKCKKCGYEVDSRAKFCPNCGEKMNDICPNCGNVLEEGTKYCPNCGYALEKSNIGKGSETVHTQRIIGSVTLEQESTDVYEEKLDAKAQMEKLGNMISFTIIAILCFLLYMHNRDSSGLDEIAFMCAIMAFIILAIYGVIAGAMGFYGAGKYLNKYQQMKKEIGKVEAIKMIEQQYDPTKGFSLMKGGVNTAGGVVSGCFSSIVGFAITIIAIILLMAFC